MLCSHDRINTTVSDRWSQSAFIGDRSVRPSAGRNMDFKIEKGLDGSGMCFAIPYYFTGERRCSRAEKTARLIDGLQGFYNPVADRLIEPELTGISYSFTIDGHYEEAYYRAIPNRRQK